MPPYLDPKNDLVFKKIFGRHPNLLISFLNAVLPLPAGKVIKSIEYLPTKNVPELPKIGKRSIVDVRCYDQDKRHLLIRVYTSRVRGILASLGRNSHLSHVVK